MELIDSLEGAVGDIACARRCVVHGGKIARSPENNPKMCLTDVRGLAITAFPLAFVSRSFQELCNGRL